MHAALSGGPVSDALLSACLRRLRADGGDGFRSTRLALIKLILKRREIPVTETLNADERHPAYLCGRLLSVLEQIQYDALGDVNANVVDKFYGTFSAAPALVPYSHEVVLCLNRSCGCRFRQRESPASSGEARLHPGNE